MLGPGGTIGQPHHIRCFNESRAIWKVVTIAAAGLICIVAERAAGHSHDVSVDGYTRIRLVGKDLKNVVRNKSRPPQGSLAHT